MHACRFPGAPAGGRALRISPTSGTGKSQPGHLRAPPANTRAAFSWALASGPAEGYSRWDRDTKSKNKQRVEGFLMFLRHQLNVALQHGRQSCRCQWEIQEYCVSPPDDWNDPSLMLFSSGVIVGVDEDTAYSWPVCSRCGSDNLELLPGRKWVPSQYQRTPNNPRKTPLSDSPLVPAATASTAVLVSRSWTNRTREFSWKFI